ncbi:MAG TPA: hypothetical protein VJO14_05810 [Bacteroidota bacterium]|nr:hypothetical protein [Bacteroidota bacterium]
MKHRFLLTLMLLGLPSLLYSQTDTTGAAQENDATPGTWMIVASAGWTFPAEPREFKDQFKINYNFGGGIAYSMSPGDVGYGEVSLLLHYYNTLFSRSGFRTANNLPTGTGVYGYPGDVYTGMLQFRGVYGTSKESIAPYFTMAIGVLHLALPQRGLTTPPTVLYKEYTTTTFGWAAGLGVDVPVTDWYTLFVDGKFLLGVTGTSGHRLFSAGGGIRIRI